MTRHLHKKWVFYISTFLFLTGLILTLSAEDRLQFKTYFIPYTLSFIAYLTLLFSSESYDQKKLWMIFLLAMCTTLFVQPHLSNDFYRFLWDGNLFWEKINVYDYTPLEVYTHSTWANQPYLKQLFQGMGELSQKNYSCYPPVNQFYFILATAFTDSIFWNVLLLKISIFITEITGAYYLSKLLRFQSIPTYKLFFLFLNPLVLVEGIANVHFEGVMISFLIMALYFLLSRKDILSSLFFTLSIQIKLIPLLLLPFLIKWIGWKRSMFIFLSIGVFLFACSFLFIHTTNIQHFLASLSLYFTVFEFNSSILFVLTQTDPFHFIFFKIKNYAAIFSPISLLIISWLALSKKESEKSFFHAMIYGYSIYLLLSSTVHPWYVLPLLFLSLLSDYSYAILWSYTVFISYSFYEHGNTAHTNWLILLEYVPVVLLFFYERAKGGLFQGSQFRINATLFR